MRPKILFVIHNMNCGGVQSALINMLKNISNDYEIDLRCFSMSGDLMEAIPANVNILKENSKLKILGIESKKIQSYFLFFKKAIYNAIAKVFGGIFSHKLFFLGVKEDKKYDIAISYVQDVNGNSFSIGCNDYVIQCVDAKKKVTFVHCDFSRYGGNDSINRSRYKDFDEIVCVSNGCKEVFTKCLGPLKKVSVVRNFVDIENIQILANSDTVAYDSDYTNFVTVARLSAEKGLLRTLNCFKELLNEVSTFRWYIIGSGPLENEIKEKIISLSMSDHVFLLGHKSNPYRYMKNADYLILPSFHECAPVVFDEAKVLNIPIIATKTTSTAEMVEDCGSGYVCDNSEDGIFNCIRRVLISKDKTIVNGNPFVSNEQSKYTFSQLCNLE